MVYKCIHPTCVFVAHFSATTMPDAPIDQLVRDARDAFEAGVQAVHPTALMAQGGSHAGQRYIEDADCVRVATIGKAAVPWGDWWAARGIAKSGLIVAPAGYGTADRNALPDGWHQVEAGHPHPTKESAQAGRRLLEMAERCGPDDVLVVGLSGGGSACTAYPPAPISMAAVRRLNELLLHSGLPIGAVNAMRKHVLRVGGGRLAAAAHPGRVWCQAISDVPGDDLSTIASGPTVGDPTTYADAIAALHKAAVWDDVPRVVRTHLQERAVGILKALRRVMIGFGTHRLLLLQATMTHKPHRRRILPTSGTLCMWQTRLWRAKPALWGAHTLSNCLMPMPAPPGYGAASRPYT